MPFTVLATEGERLPFLRVAHGAARLANEVDLKPDEHGSFTLTLLRPAEAELDSAGNRVVVAGGPFVLEATHSGSKEPAQVVWNK